MSAIYDNWERLVAAALKKQQFWELCHAPSRSPSVASDLSSSFNSSCHSSDPAFEFSIPGSSSESQRVIPKFVLISEFSPTCGVNDFKLVSAELLGRGTFGSSYRAKLTNGVRIVVKRLKSISISAQEFRRNMEIVGNIRHENVAPLRAYYSSKSERLMLYDYYSRGTVFALLHGQSSHVDWETRLRIAIGAARGIVEIHSQDGGKFVHGNIKSSNILLSAQEYGCVSDLVGNMMRAQFIPKALCYAPEVKSTHSFSQESDVYSFGILLFELLTRKSPVRVPGGPEAVDLVKLVSSVKSKIWATTVVDADLLKHHAIRDQIVKVLQIGISCVVKSPNRRPKMSDVMIMLEDLRMMREERFMREGSNVSLGGKVVFLEDSHPTFSFEDVMKVYDPARWRVLDRAAPYKVRASENGGTFMIKRFKDVNVTYEEFLQNMKIIGRIKHGNVAELRAFYFSNKEVLLVYDYYDQPVLSTFESEMLEIPPEHLEWAKRLKIAIGVASGISHIHRQDNCKLVHGNIKPSNIFINGEGYGVVSTPGLTKAINPTRQQTSGYSAPELVKDSTGISQACDVYSFGVVLLLQLFCGKPNSLVCGKRDLPPKWNTNDDDGDGGLYNFVGRIQTISCLQWTVDPDISGGMLPPFLNVRSQLLQLAMDCVAIDPDRRPDTAKVVRILEETTGIDRERKSLIESRLKNSLENLFLVESLLCRYAGRSRVR